MSEPPRSASAAEIPEVPDCTVLRLRPDEWSHCAAVLPGAEFAMTVVRVHRRCVREQRGRLWVWVVGHRHPQCGLPHVESHLPCLRLLVQADALRRAVAP